MAEVHTNGGAEAVEAVVGGAGSDAAAAKPTDGRDRKERRQRDSGEEVVAQVDAQGKLVRVQHPEDSGHKKKVADLQEQVQGLRGRLDGLKEAIGKQQAAKKGIDTQASEVLTRIKALQAEQNRERDARDALNKVRDEAKAKLEAQMARAKKTRSSAGGYRSVEDAERAISQLETRMETTTMSRQDEVQAIKQLKEMKAARDLLLATAGPSRDRDPAADRERDRAAASSIRDQIGEISGRIKDLGERLKAQREVLDTLDKQRDAEFKPQLTALYKERDEVFTELRAVEGQIREQYKAYDAQWKAWQAYSKALKKQRNEEWKANKAARQAEYEQRQREREEEEAKQKPWLAEIADCDALIAYVEGQRPRDAAAESAAAATAAAAKADEVTTIDGGKGKGTLTMRRKGEPELDDWGFGGTDKGKKKGKKKGGGGQKKRQTLTHGLDTLAHFAKLGIEPPNEVADIERALTELKAKRHYYDTKPRPVKKKAPAAAAASASATVALAEGEVATPYGAGTVQSTREDGTLVVKMSAFEATAYLQPSQLKASA